jgi:ribosome recycling factor
MEDFIKDFEVKVKAVNDSLKQELLGVRANRPTTKLVEDIKADYYNQLIPIKQLASITIVPPREIDISAWDKNAVAPIAKAIEASKSGLTANMEGNLIRIYLPPLTEERKQELTKYVKSVAEANRIKIRATRDEFNKKIQQAADAKTITEDDKFKFKKQIQDLTDKINKDIETILIGKIKEISE